MDPSQAKSIPESNKSVKRTWIPFTQIAILMDEWYTLQSVYGFYMAGAENNNNWTPHVPDNQIVRRSDMEGGVGN